MKAMLLSFFQMFRQMKKDAMLLAIAFVPVLVGALFRFGIPFAETQLINYLEVEQIISPYYGLLDLFLVMLTPSMYSFIVAMVVLEEADERLISYLAVTPLGKKGYLLSRFGMTGIISLFMSVVVVTFFHLASMNAAMLIVLVIVSTVQGICSALLIVAFSANKVEGMAVGKFTMLFTLGALAPFFISGKAQYLFSALPSYWLAKAVKESNYTFTGIGLLVTAVWILLLVKRFEKKL
ncbi:fluoroquinolone transport system permease protein [Lachnospiraceae bacterium PF1-21]|uniref:ABC transporter permease n=1 Tax=Ohessyouella blattaphilus TaxID=2949333 RepID=A0ABT1EJ78_9FIRM|nr:ABC transporter permease [Ohessyouella blattaphilus]MCP1110748.1 ABC transporter permease [Ohessyouella blattaphilus]MCR8564142.1 ABC transporter permease [Ohessyouella blattaphilus]